MRFFPGLLPRTIAGRFAIDPAAAALVPVGASHFLIPPGYRDTDPATAAPALDAMEEVEALDAGLKALAQTFCTAHFADSAALAALASDAFHSGEFDLARELAAQPGTSPGTLPPLPPPTSCGRRSACISAASRRSSPRRNRRDGHRTRFAQGWPPRGFAPQSNAVNGTARRPVSTP